MTTAAAVFGALLLASTSSEAAVSAAAFEAAWQQFQRANAGDEQAIASAAEQFGKLSASEPGDPLVLAYSGAATAMLANTTLLPWRKLSLADDGLAQIDKALALLNPEHDRLLHMNIPASLQTRFVAATTFLRMPGMFNRQIRGARLLEEVLTTPQLEAAPLGFRAAVWLRAGVEAARANRHDDARRWLQQVVASGTPQAGMAQAKLKELP